MRERVREISILCNNKRKIHKKSNLILVKCSQKMTDLTFLLNINKVTISFLNMTLTAIESKSYKMSASQPDQEYEVYILT